MLSPCTDPYVAAARFGSPSPRGRPVYPHRPMTATRRPDTLARERAHELVRSWDGRPGALGSLLGRVSSVDQVGVEERVDALKKRSIKKAIQALGPRPRDPDDGPHDARGKGHSGQDPGALPEGDDAAARRPDDPVGRRDLRLPGARRRGQGRPQGLDRQGRIGRDGLPVGPDVPRHQDRRDAGRRRGRRRRGRHGDRPRRVPQRRLPDRLRGDRRRQGCDRRRPPQGHPRDRRARDVRQRPPGVGPRDGRRRRLHQDLDRQGPARGDAPGHARHARGDPRLRAPDGPPGRDEAGRRDPRRQGSDPVPRRAVRDPRAALDEPRTGSASGHRRSSTTSSCRSRRSGRAATRTRTTSRSTDGRQRRASRRPTPSGLRGPCPTSPASSSATCARPTITGR